MVIASVSSANLIRLGEEQSFSDFLGEEQSFSDFLLGGLRYVGALFVFGDSWFNGTAHFNDSGIDVGTYTINRSALLNLFNQTATIDTQWVKNQTIGLDYVGFYNTDNSSHLVTGGSRNLTGNWGVDNVNITGVGCIKFDSGGELCSA